MDLDINLIFSLHSSNITKERLQKKTELSGENSQVGREPPYATPVFAIFPKRKHIHVFKLIKYHFHIFFKHVLAPQNDFGIGKKTW